MKDRLLYTASENLTTTPHHKLFHNVIGLLHDLQLYNTIIEFQNHKPDVEAFHNNDSGKQGQNAQLNSILLEHITWYKMYCIIILFVCDRSSHVSMFSASCDAVVHRKRQQ